MRQVFVTVSALLLASTILTAGNGLQITLLPVRASLEGFSLTQIGLMLSVYFLGYVVGCRVTPVFVRNVGHVRSFTALASVASVVALAHALALVPSVWIVLRGVTGLCLAGLAMIIESWLNEKADNRNRGSVLGIYRVIDFSAMIAGQSMLTLADPAAFTLFALSSILISLALVPVALTTSPVPRPIPTSRVNLAELFKLSPLAAVGVTAVGLANSTFWGLGPVFVQSLGYGTGEIALFMGAVVGGGALSQWPLGALSDRLDRRKVIMGVSVCAAISGAALATAATRSEVHLLLAALAFGAFAMPLWGLCTAHANDHCSLEQYVPVSAGLLMLFGIGAVVGPLLATPIIEWFGVTNMFLYTATVHSLLFGFGLYRLPRSEPVAERDKETYVAVPRTTPAVFELNPHTQDDNSLAE